MKIKHKFAVTYIKSGEDYVAFATNIPGIIIQDVSLERIKKRMPKLVKHWHEMQIQELKNGINLIEVGPEDWPGFKEMSKD